MDDRFTRGGSTRSVYKEHCIIAWVLFCQMLIKKRKFAQLYISDSSAALDRRMNIFPTLDRRIMGELQSMLAEHNPYVQMYEYVCQQVQENPVVNLELRLLCLKSNDRW